METSTKPPAAAPCLNLPETLPVCTHAAEIIAAIQRHQVIIVCGETGSGKTTQLPKLAWLAGRGQSAQPGKPGRRIGMTEPRRIAARSVAQRLAQETQTQLGQFIGWKVRFNDAVSAASRIKVMTDGILLAETQSDPRLAAYDTIILDEAHERSLNIDFLLGFLHNLLPRRPDLKLILSSATLEAERFSGWFGKAPIIEVSGRNFPVELRYRPTENTEAAAEAADGDLHSALLAATDELAAHGPGDILIFLPGEREIREAQEALRKHHPEHTEILPLFARLSITEQDRIFQPYSGQVRRRIVLSTNVAETSLTVPGIRFVIDTGLARVKRYSLKNRIEQLKTEKVAQAQANQRAGRCGRVGPGVCIRLYGEDDFQARPVYPTPELLRSSLAGVILRMQALRLPDISEFPFLDAPEPRRIRDGQALLHELGAVDEGQRLTKLGQQLARLPVDPRIGRMLLAGHQHACLHEIVVIAAFLSVLDPRERPLDRAPAADEKHRRFAHPKSDFLAILNLWQHVEARLAHRKSQRKLREQLHAEFLSPLRIREWREVYAQLATLVRELGYPIQDPTQDSQGTVPNTEPWATRYAPIHQALLTGLLGNLGVLTEEGSYLGARDIRFLPFPGSGVNPKPQWLMAAEIVETRRVYARNIARVEPEWIEATAAHLLKFSYSDPHWGKKPARVNAKLRATLHGLPVINGRRVDYGPIDPGLCREFFIRHALVRGEYESRAPFFRHNQALLDELDALTQRTRNAHLDLDEERIAAFFAARLPDDVGNGSSFETWRHSAEKRQPKLLFLAREDLFPATHNGFNEYPEFLDWEGQHWVLSYRFEPGATDDGVTLSAPIAALQQIPAARCSWLVPGLLPALIEALIRSLPQSLRRNFIPAPAFTRAAVVALQPNNTPLPLALGEFLARTTGVSIPTDAWRPDNLPAHLRMNFRLQDEQGKTVAEDRHLAALQTAHGSAARSALGAAATHIERENITRWAFGDLPEKIDLAPSPRAKTRANAALHAWPALTEKPDGSVALKPFDHPASAQAAHRRGVCRLYWLSQAERLKQTQKVLEQQLKAASLTYALWGGHREALVHDFLFAVTLHTAPSDPATIRDAEAFAHWSRRDGASFTHTMARFAEAVVQSISQAHTLQTRLAKLSGPLAAARTDMEAQLGKLVFVGCIGAHPPAQLLHLPRYLAALEKRLDKLGSQRERDAQLMREIAPLQGELEQLRGEAHETLRWLIEELRVSLFAQELKTPEPVSVKRLEKRLAELKKQASLPGLLNTIP